MRIEALQQSSIRMGHEYGQTPPNVYGDFDWIRHHEPELREKYGECSIIVYKHQVIGVGRTYAAALENSEGNLPPQAEEITPVHQWYIIVARFQGFIPNQRRVRNDKAPPADLCQPRRKSSPIYCEKMVGRKRLRLLLILALLYL